ncbi:MAG: UDP-N-acetylmuramate--L-alanine ligase [Paramuribaculum sp.]|nr:UDP-N-acetylmuramate--L-alanine ligase [Paramuribaculum sp.]
MDFKHNIYFLGAGGIGMAALERYFLNAGCRVGGYDRTPSALTDALVAEGVNINFTSEAEAIPEEFRNPDTTLVVYTPAVPETNGQMQWFRANGFEPVKRAKVLGIITSQLKGLCFAGTHGKTTTSSMAAHILHSSSAKCNAFLGGVLRNYNTNCLLSADSSYAVIEADEYDRSFHHLHPYVAVITSMDPDHLDIYGTAEAYYESFAVFTEKIVNGGKLLLHTRLPLESRFVGSVYRYSRDEGDFHAQNIRRANGSIIFDFVHPQGVVTDIELGVPVEVNIENAIAAMAAVWLAGEFEEHNVRQAMKSFMGPKRRFEFWHKEAGADGLAIIDDYAHHPMELKRSIESVKALYPGRELTVAFQPHLYSRTHDFASEFAQALSLADNVLLLDIYPAREEPIPGVTSDIIFKDITSPGKTLVTKDELVATVAQQRPRLLLTVGAGDICNYLPEIVKILTAKS